MKYLSFAHKITLVLLLKSCFEIPRRLFNSIAFCLMLKVSIPFLGYSKKIEKNKPCC